MSRELYIAPSAKIDESATLGVGAQVGRGVTLGERVVIEPFVKIRSGAKIGRDSLIKIGALIGPNMLIGNDVIVHDGAKIGPNKVKSVSSDGRTIEDHVIVGPDVLLHDEIELGWGAIVPSQRTIAAIGNFGTKNRVVTIYGSDQGPRYSIGCQIGVSMDRVNNHVQGSFLTIDTSAATYAPYLHVFEEIGSVVQNAYDDEYGLVEELKAHRDEYMGRLETIDA